ncbi:DUF1697 domain-containing protein [Streptomyces triticirhizae]|nr:DUF1697 domain-containing protein [Streptomyces triticirhizae]
MSEQMGAVARVALLRGVNVGGRRKVPMAALREALAARGFGAVRTHLHSGNVVFTAPPGEAEGLAGEISAVIEERFGFPVDCLVLTAEELRGAARRCPFPADDLDASKLLVLFLGAPAAGLPVAGLDPAEFAPEELRLGEREVFAYFPGGMGRSRLGARLVGRVVGERATGRNWRTVAALLALLDEVERAGA